MSILNFEPSVVSDPIFRLYDCKVCDGDLLDSVDWIPSDLVQRSKHPNFPYYVRPIQEFASHVIWGGGFGHENYKIAGILLEEELERKLNSSGNRVVIANVAFESRFVIEASHFSFSLADSFLRWSGHQQQYMAILPKDRLLIMQDEELEYLLYCRDPRIHANPFEQISDSNLVDVFGRDKARFASPAIDVTRLPMLEDEILPYTLEKSNYP